MRTAYRVLSTAVAVGAIFPVGMPSAQAATRDVVVETAAWFWSAQVSGEAAPGVPYPGAVPRPASGVPENNLAVAYKGDQKTREDGTKESIPDKETYLAWDIYDVPEGSSVEEFVFTVFVNTEARNIIPPEADTPTQGKVGGQPELVACAPTIGFGEADGDSFDAKPTDDCRDQVFGEYDAKTSSYTFYATTYAQDWVDGKDNHGLAIRPTEDVVEPFQLNLLPATTVKAKITYTPPAPETVYTPPVFTPAPIAPLPPTDTTVFVPQPQPQVQPQPTTAPSPVVRSSAPAPRRTVQAIPLTSSRGLNSIFWFAMLGGVLFLGTMSLILGDPLVPVGATGPVRSGGRHRLAPAGVPGRSTRPIRPRTV